MKKLSVREENIQTHRKVPLRGILLSTFLLRSNTANDQTAACVKQAVTASLQSSGYAKANLASSSLIWPLQTRSGFGLAC